MVSAGLCACRLFASLPAADISLRFVVKARCSAGQVDGGWRWQVASDGDDAFVSTVLEIALSDSASWPPGFMIESTECIENNLLEKCYISGTVANLSPNLQHM